MPTDPLRTAAELRAEIAAAEADRARKAAEEREAADSQRRAQIEAMKSEPLSRERIDHIRRIADEAIRQGRMEAEIMRFPIELTTDRGRAINSNDPRWPDTLAGHADRAAGRVRAHLADASEGARLHLEGTRLGLPRRHAQRGRVRPVLGGGRRLMSRRRGAACAGRMAAGRLLARQGAHSWATMSFSRPRV